MASSKAFQSAPERYIRLDGDRRQDDKFCSKSEHSDSVDLVTVCNSSFDLGDELRPNFNPPAAMSNLPVQPAIGDIKVMYSNSKQNARTMTNSALSVAASSAPEDLALDISISSLNVPGMVEVGASETSWRTPSLVTVHELQQKCAPAWSSMKTFVLAICCLITVHGTLSSGYLMSVITTIEKRFDIQSSVAGFVVSSYEFGSLLSVLFVSYFGSQQHIPRWIGCGALLLSAGSFLFSLPHFIATPYEGKDDLGNDRELCWADSSVGAERAHCSNAEHYASNYVFVFVLAQIMLGVGGSPIFTLGTAYIDNHVSRDDSSVYLACMYIMVAVGPVCGFLLGGLMLSSYVNPNSTPPELGTGSPMWIGRWWAGFLVCGALYFASSLPMFCFPRRLTVLSDTDRLTLPAASDRASTPSSDASSEYGRSLKLIPCSLLRLMKNSVYMVATLGACADLALVSGFSVFLPKYLETQFRLSKAKASILTGSVAIPGAILGIGLGGYLMKKYKLQLRGTSNMIVIANSLALSMFALFFVFGCSNLRVAGITWPYQQMTLSESMQGSFHVNLTKSCNQNCACSLRDDRPVCGMDNITYLTACFAGCRKKYIDSQNKQVYSDCDCIAEDGGNLTAVAYDGSCASTCNMLIPFMLLLFVLVFVASTSQMPLVTVTLRSVSDEEKAFALGFQVVLLRILTYIPAPIYFGAIIDTSCLVWKEVCGLVSSACLFHNIETFRIRFAVMALILKVVGSCLSVTLWWCIRKNYVPFSSPVTLADIAHRLGSIENLHLRECRRIRSWVSDESLYTRPKSPRRHQKTRSC